MTSARTVQHLTLAGPTLSARCVAAARRSVQQPAPASVVLDCHAITRVAAAGLCALLELGHAAPPTRWILVGLNAELLRSALAAGLAERFPICRDEAAALALLHTEPLAACGQ